MRKVESRNIKFINERIIFVLSLVASLAIVSCWDGKSPSSPTFIPRNVNISIDGDSAATRDTVLRVEITGQNIAAMQLSDQCDLSEVIWERYDSLKIFHAPRVEGEYIIYGRFKSQEGGLTDVYSDTIILDFNAMIIVTDVEAVDDTLEPGESIIFSMNTGESGHAFVSLGGYIKSFRLREISEGIYRDTLIIPSVVVNGSIDVFGKFTDHVGNIADSVSFQRKFLVYGSELNPKIITRMDFGGQSNDDILYHRGYIYVSDLRRTHTINAASFTDPFYDSDNVIYTPGWCHGISANDTCLVVADHTGSVFVHDIKASGKAERVSRIIIEGIASDVLMYGRYLFVSSDFKGVYIYDMEEIGAPQEIARIQVRCTGITLCNNGPYVFVAGDGGFAVIDATVPSEPELLSQKFYSEFDNHASVSTSVSSIYFDGNLYLASLDLGVARVDVRDVRNPKLDRVFSHLSNAKDLEILYPYLYVSRRDTISVVDISNQEELPIVAQIPGVRNPRKLDLYDRYLFVSENGGMAIIDQTAPVESFKARGRE